MRPVALLHIGFVPRLAALYAAIFVLSGIQLPFFPLWLQAKGLDAQMIGLVLAAPMVARILAIPLATHAADRRDVLRGTIVFAAIASVGGFLAVALAQGPLGILVAFAVASFAFSPLMPLSETYALKGLALRGRVYGPVRLWGSAAFILGNFAAGFAADLIPAGYLIWLMVAASGAIALAAISLAPVHNEPSLEPAPAVRRSLLRDPAFVAVLIAASLIQSSHAVYYSFSALQWHALGLDGAAIAAL